MGKQKETYFNLLFFYTERIFCFISILKEIITKTNETESFIVKNKNTKNKSILMEISRKDTFKVIYLDFCSILHNKYLPEWSDKCKEVINDLDLDEDSPYKHELIKIRKSSSFNKTNVLLPSFSSVSILDLLSK